MDINQFVHEWNGRHNDEDGGYGPQCVDIVKQWEKENGWPLTGGNAIDLAKPFAGYTYTANTPTNVPSTGDIIVFNVGQYGHAGIVVTADVNKVTVFNQCYPVPTVLDSHDNVVSVGSPCGLTTYNYVHPQAKGWLHKD